MVRLLRTTAPVIALSVMCAGYAVADHKYHGGAVEAQQHGYEHGYRDGYHQGVKNRQDRDKYKPNVKDSDAGYEKYMGDKGQYKQGYEIGFHAGYDDGFYARAARFREVFGPYDDPNRARGEADRSDDIYSQRGFAGSDVAFDIGYRDGLTAGDADYVGHHDPRPENQHDFRDAEHGYRSNYGDKEAYRQRYRDGFLQGYRDGYGGRR